MNYKIISITKSGTFISEDFVNRIEKANSRLIILSTSKIIESNPTIMKSILNILINKSGYLIFLSSIAVDIFFKLAEMIDLTGDIIQILNSKFLVVAIGPSTCDALLNRGITVDLIPRQFSSRGIIDLFSRFNNAYNNKIIIPRSKLGNSYLKNRLCSLGYNVNEFHIYTVKTAQINQSWLEFSSLLKDNKIDSLIFTSPSNVKSFLDIINSISQELLPLISNIRLILSIGPLTSNELSRNNISFIESENHSLQGILESLGIC